MHRILVAAVVFTLATAAVAAELTIRLDGFTGRVEVQKGTSAWAPASAGMALARGDKIHTGFKSRASLVFPDGSVMEVQPMTMIAVDNLSSGAGGETRSRVLLRVGEVKAQVQRPAGVTGDFQVRTPTTTASVRGTRIQRIAYSDSTGTRIRMGEEGLLALLGRRGRVFLAARQASSMQNGQSSPLTPERGRLYEQNIDVVPAGSLAEERTDVQDFGVPKSSPALSGGSTFASMMGTPRVIPPQPVVEAPAPEPIVTTPIVEPPAAPPMDPPKMDPPRDPNPGDPTGGGTTRSPGGP